MRTTGFENLTGAALAAESKLPEVQNAIRAAKESAESALWMADVINRLLKTAEDKSLAGRWVTPAVDSLRSALLFSSAGLDTSLKRLVNHSLPALVEDDATVEKEFQEWAKSRLSSGSDGVDAKALVRILMTKGVSPRDSLLESWRYELTDASAQSAERVSALAKALGVTDQTIRKRIAPGRGTKTALQSAFEARNQIAHELDVTDPDAEVRKPLERIRRYRSLTVISGWCVELLDVTQVITNDVARRLS